MLSDGSLSRWPTGAAGVLIASPGSTSLSSSRGLLIGGPDTTSFGKRDVTARGVFMDYDGQPQAQPDITTRGIMLLDGRGCVVARYYLDMFPDLTEAGGLGVANSASPRLPPDACPSLSIGGVPELAPGAAGVAGLLARG